MKRRKRTTAEASSLPWRRKALAVPLPNARGFEVRSAEAVCPASVHGASDVSAGTFRIEVESAGGDDTAFVDSSGIPASAPLVLFASSCSEGCEGGVRIRFSEGFRADRPVRLRLIYRATFREVRVVDNAVCDWAPTAADDVAAERDRYHADPRYAGRDRMCFAVGPSSDRRLRLFGRPIQDWAALSSAESPVPVASEVSLH